MSKKTLEITVSGAAWTGKSTIIAVIEKALKEEGLEACTIKQLDGDHELVKESLDERLEGFRWNDIDVVIKEEAANKRSL